MSIVRLVSAAALAAVAVVPFVAPAQAATAVTLVPTAEAWYQPNPSCLTPTGCTTGVPPTSPFPSGTLHVGLAAGRETARSYLAFTMTGLTGTISAASLTVPLDTAAADGDSASAAAHILVCLTDEAVASVEGSLDAPPSTACTSSASAAYVATPEPRLQVDLAPLLDGLPSAAGIVLLPDLAASAPADAWRVVFSAHDRADGAKTAPASLTVVLEEASPGPTDDMSEPSPVSDSAVFGAVDPPVGTGFAAPSVEVPTGAGGGTPAASPGAVPVASPAIVGHYRYPVVWLFPLLLFVLVPAVAGALTKDLDLQARART